MECIFFILLFVWFEKCNFRFFLLFFKFLFQISQPVTTETRFNPVLYNRHHSSVAALGSVSLIPHPWLSSPHHLAAPSSERVSPSCLSCLCVALFRPQWDPSSFAGEGTIISMALFSQAGKNEDACLWGKTYSDYRTTLFFALILLFICVIFYKLVFSAASHFKTSAVWQKKKNIQKVSDPAAGLQVHNFCWLIAVFLIETVLCPFNTLSSPTEQVQQSKSIQFYMLPGMYHFPIELINLKIQPCPC